MATPQEIVDASKCWTCVPGGMERPVLLYIWNEIRILQGGVAMTVQELITAANCFSCIPKGLEWPSLIYLANGILEGGGAGGASCLICGDTNPVDPPPCPCGLAYNWANGGLWVWNSATVAWMEIIAPI